MNEASFRKIRLPPHKKTSELNDFVFRFASTSRLKTYSKQRYPCEFCDLQLFCKKTLSEHMLTHKSDSVCKSEKELHLSNNHLESPLFACQECNSDFSQESNFQKHCLIHKRKTSLAQKIGEHPSKCNCPGCLLKHAKEPSSCAEKSKLVDDHINIESLDSLLVSEEPLSCDEKFAEHADIHKQPLLRTNQNQYVCNVCNEKFIRKKDYNIHRKTHSNSKPPKQCKNKALSKEFTCDVCNKTYNLKIAFMSHQMSHVATKHECEVCHKEFASTKNLKLHFRSHSDMRIFFCELCNKGFKHKHHLKAHFITHTDEVPFVCEVCNKGFKYKWGLKQHELVHAKEMLLQSEICGERLEQGCELDKQFSAHSEAEDCGQATKLLTAKDEPNRDIATETCRVEESVEEKVAEKDKKSSHEMLMETNAKVACKIESS